MGNLSLLLIAALFFVVGGQSQMYKLVCTFTNWSQYRSRPYKFYPDYVDGCICTHINFAFATISSTYQVMPLEFNDLKVDSFKGSFQKITDLKNSSNPYLKVLLSIGGWNQGDAPFSRVIRTDKRVATFVRSAIRWARMQNFDGIDIAWEFRFPEQSPTPNDKRRYTYMLQNLYDAFQQESLDTGRERLILSVTLAAEKEYIDAAYDIPEIAKYIDHANILTYDYHDQCEEQTGLNAPLYPSLQEIAANNLTLNQNWTINYYVELGMPKNKIIMGLPTYGRRFTLDHPSSAGVGSLAILGRDAGDCSKDTGQVTYGEICTGLMENIQDYRWQPAYDNVQISPYAHWGSMWVAYDDANSLRIKSKYIIDNELGGAMIWSFDFDDFNNECNFGRYPLINAVKDMLGVDSCAGPPTQSISATTPSRLTPAPPASTATTVATTTAIPARNTTVVQNYTELCTVAGQLLAHNPDCRKFVQCVFMTPVKTWVIFDCPQNQYFSEDTLRCEHLFEVPDCFQPPTSPTTPTKEVTESIPTTRPGITSSPTAPLPTTVTGMKSSPTIKPTVTSESSVTASTLATTNTRSTATTKPRFTTTHTPEVCPNTDYNLMCYYHSNSINVFFYPDMIPSRMCTHVIFAFAILMNNEIRESSPSDTDANEGLYQAILRLKTENPSLKILLSLGGWGHPIQPFVDMISTGNTIRQFALSAIDFLRQWGFDGLDIAWLYPADAGGSNIIDQYTTMIRTVSRAFDSETRTDGTERLLLTAAMGALKNTIDNSYNLRQVASFLDFINVFSFDYHTHCVAQTGLNAPLYQRGGQSGDELYLNQNWTVNYFISNGVPREKLNLGIPTYGRQFTLDHEISNGNGAISVSTGCARESGIRPYPEICNFLTRTTSNWDNEQRAPFASFRKNWMGYDNIDSVGNKTAYVKEQGLAGAMVWSLGSDDFNEECGQGPFPLINKIKCEFSKSPTSTTTSSRPPTTTPAVTDVTDFTDVTGDTTETPTGLTAKSTASRANKSTDPTPTVPTGPTPTIPTASVPTGTTTKSTASTATKPTDPTPTVPTGPTPTVPTASVSTGPTTKSTASTATKPTDPTPTVPTGPTRTVPTASVPTGTTTKSTASTATKPTGPTPTVPTGPTPTVPTASVPTGSTTKSTASTATKPTDPTPTVPTGLTPTVPTASVPTGSTTKSTASTATKPTDPTPTVPTVPTPTVPTASVPTGTTTKSTASTATKSTGPTRTVPSGPTSTVPTGITAELTTSEEPCYAPRVPRLSTERLNYFALCEHNLLFPYNPDCTKYIHCTALAVWPQLMSCPKCLYYNKEEKVCDHPENVKDCLFPGETLPITEDPYTTVITTPTQAPCEYPPRNSGRNPDYYKICREQDPRFLYPFEADCTKYVHCVHLFPVVKRCPLCLFFEEISMVCEFSQNVRELGQCLPAAGRRRRSLGEIRRTKRRTTTKKLCDLEGTLGHARQRTVYAGEQNFGQMCRHARLLLPVQQDDRCYIRCRRRGSWIMIKCPSGQYFNTVTKRCDIPGKVSP